MIAKFSSQGLTPSSLGPRSVGLSPTFEPKKIDEEVRGYWGSIDVRRLVQESRSDGKVLGFVEGPPTMNGEPHVGHLRGRILKDLWYRFSILKGFKVVFRAGWDCQGLPIELQAEHELGLTGSKADNLSRIGEEALVEACKRLIRKYNKSWVECDRLLGMSMDYDGAYWTYKDEYIEREWKYLERAWSSGVLGEGYRVVAYCPSCQTSLSHAEVAQGYEMVEDPSLYFKMRLMDEDAYLILWTTMPFTIVTDELVGVKPEAEYAYVQVAGETWIVALQRMEALMGELGIKEFRPVKVVLGAQLEGKRYEHPLKDYVPGQASLDQNKAAHTIVAEDFVDTSAGTGLVHLSPANGEEDFQVATKRGVPVFNPFDDQAFFTKDAGVFDGVFAREADGKVAELLSEGGALIRLSSLRHEYPCCWRSHHKLIWLARREYFYWVEKLGDLATRAAERVQYFYEAPKNRFLEIIKEKVPWCISRERVWGTPLPIWVCLRCGERVPAFSRKEIVERAIALHDGANFELHRPWIDKVTLRCMKCGGEARREPYVLDTWHNSGAAPYSSLSESEYEQLVPVEFLTEGIDQTRGWAYTLLIENIILRGEPEAPYRSFLFQGHVLDERGEKMSKSLGNIVDGFEVLSKSPVDVLRFYLVWKASPIESLNFSFKEMAARPYQVLSTLYYLHVYFRQNSLYDGFDSSTHTLMWSLEKELLRPPELWMLSKLQGLISLVTERCEHCRFHEAARAIEGFLIEDVSQRYVPMTRGEIWSDDPEGLYRRHAIYSALAHVLRTLDIIAHPIAPHLTEYLYRSCFEKGVRGQKSVLLEGWPSQDQRFAMRELEEEFELIFRLVSLANAARTRARIKRRWPLRRAVVLLDARRLKRLRKHARLLQEQMNVKDMFLKSRIEDVPLKLRLHPRQDVLGPRYKSDTPEILATLREADGLKLYRQLLKKGSFEVRVGEKRFTIYRSDLSLEYIPKEGHALAEGDGLLVALFIERDEELISEGVVRDLARRLQALRKEGGYNPTEVLTAAYLAGLDDELFGHISSKMGELAYLVRVKEVKVMPEAVSEIPWSEVEIDGKPIKIHIA